MRTTSKSLVATGAIVLLALLSACSAERQDWQSAQTADTLESYDAFLSKHPDSEFATKARDRTKQLTEERDWRIATEADTADAYRNFIAQHPEGKWTQEARVRFENFNVVEGGSADAAAEPAPVATPALSTPLAGGKPTPTSVPPAAAAATPAPKPAVPAAAATSATPAPKPAAPAAAATTATPAPKPAATPTASSHRIQLGAFSSEAKAKSEWERLRGQFADLKGLVARYESVDSKGSTLWRLQASVASEQRARELCAALRSRDQACLYVEK